MGAQLPVVVVVLIAKQGRRDGAIVVVVAAATATKTSRRRLERLRCNPEERTFTWLNTKATCERLLHNASNVAIMSRRRQVKPGRLVDVVFLLLLLMLLFCSRRVVASN